MARKQDWIIGGLIVCCLAVFAILALMFIFGVALQSNFNVSSSGNKIAVVELNGVIYSSKSIVGQLENHRKNRSIKAIILRIDSPGGGVAASQEIYEAVKKVRDSDKPIVVSMGSVAASGAYYAALGADSLMANLGTTTGSIGVVAEIPNISRLLEKIGVNFTIIKSGKYKDTGSPYRDLSTAEKKYLQGWIDDAFNQFVDAVAAERHLPRDDVLGLADGRVYTGLQALKSGLVDTLGTFQDAVQLAADIVGITGEPRLIYQRQQRKITLFDVLFGDLSIFLRQIGTWPRIKYQLMF